MDEPPPMKRFRGQGEPVRAMAVMVVLPWMLFTLMVCLFAFLFGELMPMVWLLLLSCAVFSILMGGFYIVSHRTTTHAVLGLLCIEGCVFGAAFGSHIERNFFREYSRLDNGAKYHNVQPAEPAASHADASIITFSVNSAIDTLRAVGFRTANDVYCVAPILDGTEKDNTVEYWAVGKNCCADRAGFECDDALDPNAHGGTTYPDDDSDMQAFAAAIARARDVHGFGEVKAPLKVQWLLEPHKVADILLNSGVYLVAGGSLIHFAISIVLAVIVSRVVAKAEAKRRLKESDQSPREPLYGSRMHEMS